LDGGMDAFRLFFAQPDDEHQRFSFIDLRKPKERLSPQAAFGGAQSTQSKNI
jgi:hypothetical protein